MLDSFASSRWQECYNWLVRPLNDEHMACPLQSNNKRLSLESHLQMTYFILDSLSLTLPTLVVFHTTPMPSSLHSFNFGNMLNINYDTRIRSGQETATEDKAVQYRQLISRATTQRFHSTSVDDLTQIEDCGIMDNTVEAWELRERAVARAKAQATILQLDIPWGTLQNQTFHHCN